MIKIIKQSTNIMQNTTHQIEYLSIKKNKTMFDKYFTPTHRPPDLLRSQKIIKCYSNTPTTCSNNTSTKSIITGSLDRSSWISFYI